MKCNDCYLSQHSIGQILPKGSINPDIYFIYDEPEDDDLRFGTISNGPRGRYLESFLNSLSISNYRIWSLVRCCAYANETYDKLYNGDVIYPKDVTVRQPNNDEISACSKYIKMDIKKTNPKVIVPLGGVPLSWLLGKSVKISDYVGRVIDAELDGVKYKVVPIYSPTYIINNKNNTELLKDFCNYLIIAKNVASGTWVDIMAENQITYALDYASFKEYYVTHLLNQSDCLAYDIETNAELVFDKKFDIIGFSLAKKRDGCYVCMKSLDYQMSDTDIDLCKKLLVAILKTTKKVVVHNCLYERPATLYNLGYDFPFEQLDDTLVMAKLMLGGKVGAGLKPNAKRIGYPDWDRDKDNYVDLFTKMLSRLRLKRYSSVIDGFRNNKSLITILDEYKVQGVEKDFGEIFDFYDELRNILLRYYEESEIDNIISKFSEKMLYAFDNGIPSTIPYSWIPYKLLCKYGATDSLATYDLMDYYNKRFDEESTKDVDLHKGYKYDLMEHYAGHNIIMSSLKWDDNAAEKDYENFNKICLESLRYLFNNDKVQEYVYKYHAFDNMTDLVYEYYNDYFWDHFGRRIIQYDETTYKLEMKKDNGSTKKMHIKHLFDDNIYEQLPESIKNDLRSKSMAKINETIKTTNDLEVLKSYFNPASTVAEVTELATAVLVNPELRFRHFLKTIYDEVITNETFDINNYQEPDKSFLEEYIKYKDIKAENYKDRIDPYNKLMEHFDNISRFNDEILQDLVGKARNWKLDGLDDESQILIYNDMCVGPINPDDPDSWTDLFKWLINLRSYKKSVKIISAYINGKVGRDSVWVVEKKPLEEGSDVVPRIRRYSDCKFVNNRPVLNDNETFLEQTNFGVGNAETGRWRSAYHVLPTGSSVKKLYRSRFRGGTILQPDFSANEMRCIASAAHEENMLKAFRDGLDIHRSNAAKIYNVPYDEVTKFQRRFAKTMSFGTLYGMSETSMAYEYFGGDKAKAHEQLTSFYNAFPDLKKWIDARHKECIETGKVSVLTQRFLNIDFDKNDQASVAQAMRRAQNYPVQSLSFDTLVKGLDGKDHKIGELAENHEDIWIYAYDLEYNKVVPCKTEAAQCTGTTDVWYKITLDNGKSIKVTPDHLMMTRDGEYVRADHLKVGTSLMPLYLSGDDYLSIDNNPQHFDDDHMVHRLVHNYFYGDQGANMKYAQVHHINMDSHDNRPENLVKLSDNLHCMYHKLLSEYCKTLDPNIIDKIEQTLSIEIMQNYTPENAKNIIDEFKMFHTGLTDSMIIKLAFNSMGSKNQRRSQDYPEWNKNQKISVEKEVSKRLQETGNVLGVDSETYHKILSNNWSKFKEYRKSRLKEGHNKPESIEAHRQASYKRESNPDYVFNRVKKQLEFYHKNNLNWRTEEDWDKNASKYDNRYKIRHSSYIKKYMTWNLFVNRCDDYLKTYNHKIVDIEVIKLDKPEPKYDLHVPGYQNFALSCGVFTHNSAASTVAAVVFCDIILHQRSLNYKTKPICFIHDSLESDVYPYELLSVIKYQQYELANGAKDYFDLALKADISMGISMGHECELSELEIVDDKETKGYLTLEGWEDEILDTIENWKLAYHKVEIVDRQMEEVYTPMDQMFIPRKAYDPSVMSKRNSGKLKVYIEYYDENGNIDPMAKDMSQVNITDLWKNSPLLQYLGK